jgi:DNA-binding response OmpR family regulator
MKLLVVDDQESIGMIVSEVARHGGWESSFISDAAEVSATVTAYKPDVMLIDRFMPGANGLEVVEQLRKEGHEFPILLFSGDTADLDTALVERLQIAAVLTKPISLKELRSWLNQFNRPQEAV